MTIVSALWVVVSFCVVCPQETAIITKASNAAKYFRFFIVEMFFDLVNVCVLLFPIFMAGVCHLAVNFFYVAGAPVVFEIVSISSIAGIHAHYYVAILYAIFINYSPFFGYA